MTGAGRIPVNRPDNHRGEGGAAPTPALQELRVKLIPHRIAKLVLRRHYLGSLAGATQLSFGVFVNARLEGAVTLGCGPMNGHRLVEGASREDYMCLSRLWLSERPPRNSESRVLGVVSRMLRRHTGSKFLISYADPAQGHRGVVYQAAGWLYVGMSLEADLYSIDGGRPQHSRSLSHRMGSHSLVYLRSHGIKIEPVRQQRKHRYVLFLDPGWRERLVPEPQPYPRKSLNEGR